MLEAGLHVFLLALALILVNWRAATPAIRHVEDGGLDAVASTELVMAVCLAAIILLLLKRAGLLREYLRAWRRNSLLAVFGAFALLSLLWSVSPFVSLHKWAVFALATLAGSYLGFRFRSRGVLRVLFWYGAALAILSAAVALLLPHFGRMFFPPYDGAWRGIFWHKNHLGTLLALLSTVSLYRLEEAYRTHRARMLLDGTIYLLQALLVYLSRSATGVLVFLASAAFFSLAYAWHRTRQRWERPHYLAALATAGSMLVLLFVFSDDLLALLGKDATLTGRLPMWEHVLSTYVSQRPALGYGLGAFWDSAANRQAIQQAVNWGYAVQIGDNGWLDVLLGLGALGLGLFLLGQLGMLGRSIQQVTQGGDFIDTLPLVFLLAALLANVAFSLFFETESGVWLILVALLFLPTSGKGRRPPATLAARA
jgi:exopolysaccharide production protein ExoQ